MKKKTRTTIKHSKYEFPNSYSEWGEREGFLMHGLMLKWRERFIWFNVLWYVIGTYLLTRNLRSTALIILISLFIVTLVIAWKPKD